MKKSILYVFSGEKAQGAEIVIERLMMYNASKYKTHLFIAPGDFAHHLQKLDKPYKINMFPELCRLFRKKSSALSFYVKAVKNHFIISYHACRYIKKNKIDIIHANNIVAASYLIPLVLFSKLFLRKKIWLWGDHDMGYDSKIDRGIAAMASRIYNRTLVVSEAVSKKYKANRKIQVLYNGLDTDLFKPDQNVRVAFRQKLNVPGDAIIIGMAAKIIPGKGQLGLIRVFDRLSKRFPGIYLLLAGDFAQDHPEYCEKVKAAFVSNEKIIHAGFLNDVIPYYNGSDIIVSNSNLTMNESLGTTIYEAMAFEKIVVAAAAGGTPEIITDEVDGFLFQPEQEEELQAALNKVIRNFSEFDDLKTRAREKVLSKFNIVKMAHHYNELLSSLSKNAPSENKSAPEKNNFLFAK